MSRNANDGTALATVYGMQVARVRVARVPLLFVALLQSLGLLVLMRGVVADGQRAEQEQVVAGAVILVVGFVALNLLAQRFGLLAATHGLDFFTACGVRAWVVVLGTAAAYATFALPGTVVVAVVGALLYDLPLANLWVVLPAAVAGGAALSGLGAALGLAAPRPELATVAGQLGMTAVLFLGFVRAERLPAAARPLRWLVPSGPPTDVVRAGLRPALDLGDVAAGLTVSLGYAVVALLLATAAYRRAVQR